MDEGAEFFYESECVPGGDEVRIFPSKLDIKIDFSSAEFDEDQQSVQGTLIYNYNVVVSEISQVWNASSMECTVNMGVDAATRQPTIENVDQFQEFACVVSINGNEINITYDNSITGLNNYISDLENFAPCSDLNAQETGKYLRKLSDEHNAHLLVRKVNNLVGEFFSGEE